MGGSTVQFTIESRHLTNERTPHRVADDESPSTVVEASDEGDAISRFVRDSESELVSFHSLRGREAIATVRKNDTVFLVRVYAG